MKLIVVIPAFQEEASIGQVVKELLPLVDQVVVVDDSSTDRTAVVAAAAGATVLHHIINRGYGAALTTGSDYAVTQGADLIAHFDADGQFDPTDLPVLVKTLQNAKAQVALGSRFKGQALNMPWLRRLTLKLAIIFTWLVSGIRLTDAHNGFRLFTQEAWRMMNLRQDRMAFSSEVIDEIKRWRLPWVEVPVTVRYTNYSLKNSKQGSWPALKIVKDLFLGRLIR